MAFAGLYNYWIVVVLMMIGFYVVIAQGNLVKKIFGLNIFQVSVFVLYITMARSTAAPRRSSTTATEVYSNPLPHVLILTAIVVGVATMALGLALVVRIREAYGTIEEDEIERRRTSCRDQRPSAGSAGGDAADWRRRLCVLLRNGRPGLGSARLGRHLGDLRGRLGLLLEPGAEQGHDLL